MDHYQDNRLQQPAWLFKGLGQLQNDTLASILCQPLETENTANFLATVCGAPGRRPR